MYIYIYIYMHTYTYMYNAIYYDIIYGWALNKFNFPIYVMSYNQTPT